MFHTCDGGDWCTHIIFVLHCERLRIKRSATRSERSLGTVGAAYCCAIMMKPLPCARGRCWRAVATGSRSLRSSSGSVAAIFGHEVTCAHRWCSLGVLQLLFLIVWPGSPRSNAVCISHCILANTMACTVTRYYKRRTETIRRALAACNVTWYLHTRNSLPV